MASRKRADGRPAGLRAAGVALWQRITAEYDFSSAPERLVLLEEACRCADMVDRLQKIVDAAEDLRVRGSQGQPVALPEIPELRQHRAQLMSLIKALGCPDDETDDDGHLTRSQIGKLGAAARWRRG
ncbi:MAG: hypothetical protein WCJ42_12010 [Actinomycetes bacterium]